MPWKTLRDLSLSGTNMPVEWLFRLRFNVTYDAVLKILGEEKDLQSEAERIANRLKTLRFFPPHSKKWKKLLNNLSHGRDISPHISILGEDPSVDPSLRKELTDWQSRFQRAAVSLETARDTFLREFEERRAALWALASEPRFQLALFQLNPSFLEHIRRYFSQWMSRNRDSEMRKKENTLVSYLSRFCAKNSAVGSMGPTFGGFFSGNKNIVFEWNARAESKNGVGDREVFFAHWCAQALANAIARSNEIRLRLPLRLHPAVFFMGHELVSCAPKMKDEFLPSEERAALSESMVTLIQHLGESRGAIDLIQAPAVDSKDREAVEMEVIQLLSRRFLLDGLDIPPGDPHPLEYLRALLRTARTEGPELAKWNARLTRFEELRVNFGRSNLDEQVNILKTAGHLFQEATSENATRGAGEYYADRFIFYEDCARDCQPLQIGRDLARELRDHYTLALELLAPFWLFRILPAVFVANRFEKHIKENLEADLSGFEAAKKISEFAESLLAAANQPLSDQMKADDEVVGCLSALTDLAKMAQQIFTSMDPSQREIILSEEQPDIKAYRRTFREVMINTNLPLPVYASGPIFQLAAKDLSSLEAGDFRIVFDSVIFGNSMHLTVLNYFATDRAAQMEETEAVLKNLVKANVARLAHFIPWLRQHSKFTPWIGGGIDIEWMGPSFKDENEKTSLRDFLLAPHSDHPICVKIGDQTVPVHFSFPNQIRFSRKLIHERFSGHFPRLRIGKTVLQRENWRLPSSTFSLPPRKEKDIFLDYVDAIRTQIHAGLPELVFVDPSGPKKNIMIDFRNFFLVEVLFGLARENEELRFSEMLPSPDEFWLKAPGDGQGSYTVGLMPFVYFEPDKSN
ncbi:MAG TPA: lantibiotic dehydratase [Bdellovibrionota bacterium]|nr:lantibiotic dehydratase [Bdellovibrionota bacterium]